MHGVPRLMKPCGDYPADRSSSWRSVGAVGTLWLQVCTQTLTEAQSVSLLLEIHTVVVIYQPSSALCLPPSKCKHFCNTKSSLSLSVCFSSTRHGPHGPTEERDIMISETLFVPCGDPGTRVQESLTSQWRSVKEEKVLTELRSHIKKIHVALFHVSARSCHTRNPLSEGILAYRVI